MCSDMGLDGIVEFTGRVSDEKLLDYLNTSDVCVNSDEYNEMNDKSTMNKILEYMALGKPIVQFDLTEGRYSAQDASLYAKPNDAVDMAKKIIELLENPEKRKRMSEFGYNRVVNELSWEHTSKTLLEGYDRYFKRRGLWLLFIGKVYFMLEIIIVLLAFLVILFIGLLIRLIYADLKDESDDFRRYKDG